MSKALQLRQERHAISLEMGLALEKNNLARFHELDAKQEGLRAQIEALEHQNALATELNRVDRSSLQLPPVGDSSNYTFSENQRALTPDEENRSRPEYRRAWESWARTGKDHELRALGSVSGADGSTLVPAGFQREIETKLKAYSGMRQACRVITTATGNQLPWPNMDDTGNSGEFLDESAATHTADPTYSNVTLGSYLCSSKTVLVPVQLLQDAAFSMEAELSTAFAVRLGRATENAYTVGTTPITGFIVALVAATGRNVVAVGANANTGVAGDTAINSVGSDDFANLIAKVDPAYRLSSSCGFMAAASVWDSLRKMKDKYGRPIWEVSLAQGEPDRVFGYKWFVNQQMAAIGVSAISLAFGDFSKFIIRDSLGITLVRFNELFMQNHQVGFEAYLRTEGKLLQPAAFAYLQHPAS